MPKRVEDPWDRNVRRFWSIVAPLAGIGLTVYFRDTEPPAYWVVPIIIALLAVPGAGILDARLRARLTQQKPDA